MRSKEIAILLLSAPLFLAIPALAEVSGEAGRSSVYWGSAQLEPDSAENVRFSIEVEPVSFLLSSVEERYKLLRLRIENATEEPLVLSRQNDRFEARLSNAPTLGAILDLRAADSAYWDSLDAFTRQKLAYPERIEAGQALEGERVRPEVVYLYLFLPAEGMTTLPDRFLYQIASLSQTIEIRMPEATAR